MSKILLKEADYIVPILFLSVFYYDSLYTFWLFSAGNIYSFTEPPPHTHTILSEYTEYNFMNPSALQDKNP